MPTFSNVDVIRKDLLKGNKILDSADNSFQFFDLDTPWEVADVGMNYINDFISGKEDISNTLEIMDSTRLKYLNS